MLYVTIHLLLRRRCWSIYAVRSAIRLLRLLLQ